MSIKSICIILLCTLILASYSSCGSFGSDGQPTTNARLNTEAIHELCKAYTNVFSRGSKCKYTTEAVFKHFQKVRGVTNEDRIRTKTLRRSVFDHLCEKYGKSVFKLSYKGFSGDICKYY